MAEAEAVRRRMICSKGHHGNRFRIDSSTSLRALEPPSFARRNPRAVLLVCVCVCARVSSMVSHTHPRTIRIYIVIAFL